MLITVAVLVALLVCLIPTTIGGLLSAIGIAGMDRLLQAQRARHERPGRGGRRRRATRCCSTRPAPSPSATARRPSSSRAAGVASAKRPRPRCLASSLADETPEGRSDRRALAAEQFGYRRLARERGEVIAFSATTRSSRRRRPRDARLRKGAVDAVAGVRSELSRATCRRRARAAVERIARSGGTPLAVAEGEAPRSASSTSRTW